MKEWPIVKYRQYRPCNGAAAFIKVLWPLLYRPTLRNRPEQYSLAFIFIIAPLNFHSTQEIDVSQNQIWDLDFTPTYIRVIWQSMHLDLAEETKAAKFEPKNIPAEASRISVKPKLQNVWGSQREQRKFVAHFFRRTIPFNAKWILWQFIRFRVKGASSRQVLSLQQGCRRVIFNPESWLCLCA